MTQKLYVFVGKKRLFLEYLFGLTFNCILNYFKICKLYEDQVINEGEHTGYGSNADDLNGFDFALIGRRI